MSDQRDYGDEGPRQHLAGMAQGAEGLEPARSGDEDEVFTRLMGEIQWLRAQLRSAVWRANQFALERDRLRLQLDVAQAEIERLRAECADVESLWRDAAEAGAALSAAEEAIGELRADRETANTRISEQDAEIERLRAELAAARQDVADLREAFGWVLSVANWPEWYYSPSVPEVVRRLTNIDEIRGDRLDLRLLPEAERGVSGE